MEMKSGALILLSLCACANVLAFSKTGTEYTTDGSQSDVIAAIADASSGDIVNVPSGTFTWGAGGTSVVLDKAITLKGAGRASTTITLSTTGPSDGSGRTGVIEITGAGARLTDMRFVHEVSTDATDWLVVSQVSYFAVGRVDYVGGTSSQSATITSYGEGVIFDSTISGGNGEQEHIWTARTDPNTKWSVDRQLGTTNALYVEDCTFSGDGYVSDVGYGSAAVFRFCTINGGNKIDVHGKETTDRAGRWYEAYSNNFATPSSYWTAIDIRGGSGMIWGNKAANGYTIWFELRHCGPSGLYANLGNHYWTPYEYPLPDQIGNGKDTASGGEEPLYTWGNRQGESQWTYTWNGDLVVSGAIQRYTNQMNDVNATFTMQDIIKEGRDVFTEVASFDGTAGVGSGTKAAMNAITPTKTGVGFWVTDEGTWNGANSGRLYTWSGSAWVLRYEPLAYPHPLRGEGGTPATSTASIGTLRVGTATWK